MQEQCAGIGGVDTDGVLHEAYQAFCAAQALEAVAAPHFARALAVRFNLEGLRRKVQGVVIRGIQGIQLKC